MNNLIAAGSVKTEAQVFHNPVPVAVALVPVRIEDAAAGGEKIGLLTVRRAIEPKRGSLALPGGYLEYEDWRDGLRREVAEETGVKLDANAEINISSVESVNSGKTLLLFARTPAIQASELDGFVPNTETSEICVITEPTELAFPTHTQAAKDFFAAMSLPAGHREER